MKRTKRKPACPEDLSNAGVFNLTVCCLDQGIPAGVNVRVRAPSLEAARARAREVLDHLSAGTTVLRPGECDLVGGECVRLYLDGRLIADDCPVEFEEHWM